MLVIGVSVLLGSALAVQAAEVLQVRSGTVLQLGDGNRNYTVRVACLKVTTEANAEAVAWLRQQLPRRRRVNLRPVGSEDGILVARVSRLENGTNSQARPTSPSANASSPTAARANAATPISASAISASAIAATAKAPSPDLGQGLVAAGLASWLPNCTS